MTRIFALLCIFSLTAVAATRDDKMSAEEILKRHLAAIGGKEAATKFKTRVASGTIKKENDPERKFAIASEPGKIAALFYFQQYDWRLIFDGTRPHTRPEFNREYGMINNKYQEAIASGLMFNDLSLFNVVVNGVGAEAKFETKGTKKVMGKPAYVIEYRKDKKSSPRRLYFDTETFMWVRTDFGRATLTKGVGSFTNEAQIQEDQSAMVDIYVETSDFRDVDGVKLPFQLNFTVTAPIIRNTFFSNLKATVTEYKHDVTIDPKVYQ
jgi:hypothetical protein